MRTLVERCKRLVQDMPSIPIDQWDMTYSYLKQAVKYAHRVEAPRLTVKILSNCMNIAKWNIVHREQLLYD